MGQLLHSPNQNRSLAHMEEFKRMCVCVFLATASSALEGDASNKPGQVVQDGTAKLFDIEAFLSYSLLRFQLLVGGLRQVSLLS